MSLVLTTYGQVAYLNEVIAGSAWSPPLTNLLYYGRFDTHAYTDAAQASPANTWGQRIRQLRDFRESPGGSTYPYLDFGAGSSVPSPQPDLSAWGGAYLGQSRAALLNTGTIPTANFTAVFLGVPTFDYPYDYTTNGIFQIGDTFATGISVLGAAFSTAGLFALAIYHNAGLITNAGMDIDLGWTTIALQSTGANLDIYTENAGPLHMAASTTGDVTGGELGDDARLLGNWMNGAAAALLIYTPALAAPELVTLLADLAANVPLKSLFPQTFPLILSAGDSRTIATQISPVLPSQAWSHVLAGALTTATGWVIYGKSGARLDQIDSSARAGLLQHITAPGGPAKRTAIIWGGTNDFAAGANAATVLGRLTAFATALHVGGCKVIVGSEIANNGLTGPQIAEKDAFNTSLRSAFNVATADPYTFRPAGGTTWADGMVDLGAVAALSNASDATYFSDGTHLTAAGEAVVAARFQAGLVPIAAIT